MLKNETSGDTTNACRIKVIAQTHLWHLLLTFACLLKLHVLCVLCMQTIHAACGKVVFRGRVGCTSVSTIAASTPSWWDVKPNSSSAGLMSLWAYLWLVCSAFSCYVHVQYCAPLQLFKTQNIFKWWKLWSTNYQTYRLLIKFHCLRVPVSANGNLFWTSSDLKEATICCSLTASRCQLAMLT